MKRTLLLLIFFLTAAFSVRGQTDDKSVNVTGDSLFGKMVNGESIREVHGHVVMNQGAIRITCQKAIQYLGRNESELIGQVVVTQDSIIIKTDRGFYYGNTKTAYSKSGIYLTDGHIELTSKTGYYYFDEKHSFFYDKVQLHDGVSIMMSDKLDYFDNDDKAVAVGNVNVIDTSSTIFADSLIHFRNSKDTYAFNNVRIYNKSDHLALFGNKLEDLGGRKHSKISGNPFLIRIDTVSASRFDTLMISSLRMESFNDLTKKLIASDSVKILRGDFSSVNGETFYFRSGEKIETFRREEDKNPPVMWNEKTQLIGDSIFIRLKDDRLESMNLRSNASIITENKSAANRFDQVSGKDIKMFFDKEGLRRTDVSGAVLSIYYMNEDNEPNGLVKSSSERAKFVFKDKSISDVRYYGKVVSEYQPENIIKGKEKDFTIPTFRIFTNRPTKQSLLLTRSDILSYLTKDAQFYDPKTDIKK